MEYVRHEHEGWVHTPSKDLVWSAINKPYDEIISCKFSESAKRKPRVRWMLEKEKDDQKNFKVDLCLVGKLLTQTAFIASTCIRQYRI